MSRFFVVYAEGETKEEFQQEINKLLDEGFDFQGLPFASNGKLYQGMRKNTPDSVTTATAAYRQYMKKEEPYKPPPIGRDRANG